jgi:hypothetical protein
LSTLAFKSREYRLHAEECWELASHAQDVETRAAFRLTAEAWLMLADQVERLGNYRDPEAIMH